MKKLLNFIAVLILFVIFSPMEANAASFKDVTMYDDQIDYLTDLEIIKGYEDGTFKPNNPVTRLQAIQMILNEKGIPLGDAPDPGFSDVNQDTYGYDYISKAKQLNIISGKEDGRFDPYGTLTRVQMASILANAYPLKALGKADFKDIPNDFYAKDAVDAMASNEISAGYSDGTFKPFNTLTRQHFALFLAKTINDKFKPAHLSESEIIEILKADGQLIINDFQVKNSMRHKVIVTHKDKTTIYETIVVNNGESWTINQTTAIGEVPVKPIDKTKLPPVPKGDTEMMNGIVELVNKERAAVGVAPLKVDKRARDVALIRAKDMADYDYVAHVSPIYGHYTNTMDLANLTYRGAGENITVYHPVAEGAMKAWMESPGHRDNILAPHYTHIGVGVYEGGRYERYHVQIFISR